MATSSRFIGFQDHPFAVYINHDGDVSAEGAAEGASNCTWLWPDFTVVWCLSPDCISERSFVAALNTSMNRHPGLVEQVNAGHPDDAVTVGSRLRATIRLVGNRKDLIKGH